MTGAVLMLRMAAQIHWFSIINSCVTVLLLTGFLATILMRVLKNDFIKYTRDDDGARPATVHHVAQGGALAGMRDTLAPIFACWL